MQLSEIHLKHIIKSELQSLLEQEENASAGRQERDQEQYRTIIEKMDDMEANIRIKYFIQRPASNPPNKDDLWHNKEALKKLWLDLAAIGRAERPTGAPNISWKAVGKAIDPPWDPQDPPRWIPPVSREVCLKIKQKISKKGDTSFDVKQWCHPSKPINVNTIAWRPPPKAQYRMRRLSEYERCINERARKKAKADASGLEPVFGDIELAVELAMLLTYMKLHGGFAAGLLAALSNPYTLVAIFGAAVVYMAFELMESDCEDLLESPSKMIFPTTTSAPMDALTLMPK